MRRPLREGWPLGLLLIVALWPFLEFVDDAPATADSVHWMLKATPANPHWWRWGFAHSQFQVGFRPVMALTFLLNGVVAGLEHVWVYRLVDLLLHASAIVAVYAVARRWWSDEPARAGLAAALFALHPMVQSVPMALEYRGYSLSVLLSMGAVLATRPGSGMGRGMAVGALGAAALLSNEATAVALLLVPIALVQPHRPAREAVIVHRAFYAGLAVPLGLAIVWRTLVVGGVGGYGTSLAERAERLGPITTTIAQRLVDGQLSLAATPGWLTVVGLALLTALVATRAGATWREGDPRPLLLLAASLTFVLFLASQGVFFGRLFYPLLPVVSLALVSLIRSGEPGSWLLASALVGTPLLQSHGLWGVDAHKRESRALRDAWQDGLSARVAGLPPQTGVFTVLPFFTERQAPNPFRAGYFPATGVPMHATGALRWVRALHPDVRIDELAWVRGRRADVTVDGAAVYLEPHQTYALPADRRTLHEAQERTRLPLGGAAASWLYVGDAHGGQWRPLGARR